MVSEQATDMKYDYLYFMKRILLLLILIFMQLTCYPQDTISICHDLDLIKISDNAFVHVSYAELPGNSETVERIIGRYREAEIVIPGHGSSGGRELLVHTRNLSNSQQAAK
jgi:hypothetical protein